MLYDVVIVGAGINGCTSAYFLHQAGLRVALIDQNGIASGGSGAAGAFISPKISKKGVLKEIMAVAHLEALEFYTTLFPHHTLQKPLLHIAKNSDDQSLLKHYKQEKQYVDKEVCSSVYSTLNASLANTESICFEESAVINARGVCEALADGVDFFQQKVDTLNEELDGWSINGIRGNHLILCIGAYPKILPIDYVGIRGIWGHRIDVKSTTIPSCILHHFVSISPTLSRDILAIGATHDVHFSPFETLAYDIEKGRSELLEKASQTLKLDNIKIVRDYTGLRSGSSDYLPMLGSLVNAKASLALHPHLSHGKAVDPKEYHYYPNLTMVNGSGGYGFVLAPYLAKRLKEHLVDKKPLDERLSPARFFPRWAKRQ